MLKLIKVLLEHNPKHFTKINIMDTEIKACSRCLGAYTSLLIFTPIFAYMYYREISLSFWFVFITSIALGSVTFIDWFTVSTEIRKGNNNFRIFAGFLLGISASFYLWLLPESWWFRLTTILLYGLIAIIIAVIVGGKEEKRDGDKT